MLLPFKGPDDPFWMEFGESSFGTVLFAAGLAMFAAVIAGAVPALKATGQRMQSGLRSLGSRTGMKLGATWTVLVVVQVAVAVAVLPSATEWAWGTMRPAILGPGFAADEFLIATLSMEPDSLSVEVGPRRPEARFRERHAELVRRLWS